MDTLEVAWKYVEEDGRDVAPNKKAWSYFQEKWRDYLKLRDISDGKSEPKFPVEYKVQERDNFYKSVTMLL